MIFKTISTYQQELFDKMKLILVLIATIFSASLFAQSDIPIYEWKSYLPYPDGRIIDQSEDKIFYATEWSLVSLDKNDKTPSFLSKVEGLGDISVSTLRYDRYNDQLIVAYNSSNIDIIKGAEVFTISDIEENSNIVGNKSINDIEVVNSEFCYFATSFGVVEYNLDREEFGFTTSPEIQVNHIISRDGFLYAATEDGLYKVSLTSNLNLRDFSLWQLLDDTKGLPIVYEAGQLTIYNNQVYVIIDQEVYKENDDGNFEAVYTESRPGYVINFIAGASSSFMIGTWNGIDENSKSDVFFLMPDGTIQQTEENCLNRVTGAVEDSNGKIWFADEWANIRTTSAIGAPCNERIIFNAPAHETASNVSFMDGEVFVASGGVSDVYGSLDYQRGFYKLNKNKFWVNYNRFNFPSLAPFTLVNIWKTKAHPDKNIIYFGSYYSGLLEFDVEAGEISNVFDQFNNTSLQGANGDMQRTRVSGLEFDDNGNLWIANYGADEPLSVYTESGNWHSFNLGNNNKVAEMAIDNLGYKWVIAAGISGGVYVFDDNNTPGDPSDDRPARFFNLGNSALSTNAISAIKADLNGDIWVGTAEGPVVFECGASAFDEECVGTRRKVFQDSIAAFLLQTEDIRAIEVDGANRKWFGTRSGIYVQSPDGEEQVLHLNIDNSPLFDNTITTLAYNGETGEMFIGTNKGLQSFRTDATNGTKFHNESKVYAFPNPVRPEHNGPIAIRGLVSDANVKITDINGRLVYETNALGGQATWDGRDYNGVKAATGVYLVFSASTDNFSDPDSFVTKILMVK